MKVYSIKQAAVLICNKETLEDCWFQLSEYKDYDHFYKSACEQLNATPEYWEYSVYLDVPPYISDVNDLKEFFLLRERFEETDIEKDEEAFWHYVYSFDIYPDVTIVDYCFETFKESYIGVFKNEEQFASYYVHTVYKKEIAKIPKIIRDSIDYKELSILLFSQEGYVFCGGFVFKRLKSEQWD